MTEKSVYFRPPLRYRKACSFPVVFALLFMAVTAFVVYNGVEDGIEKVSRFMMPVLLVLVVVIAGYSLTLKTREPTA